MDDPVKKYSTPVLSRAEKTRLTRRRIVAASAELFLDQGYGATTLDQVAARTQVADSALDRERDAVELGGPGFGDVGDAHGAEAVGARTGQSACPCRPRIDPEAEPMFRLRRDPAVNP